MPEASSPLRVTAAILRRQGKILVARRRPESQLAGFWEFPGGKIEPGESPETCLARELEEELGILTRVGAFLCRSLHHYPERSIELLAYEVEHLGGEFRLLDHDALRWLEATQLSEVDLAPADIPIAAFLAAQVSLESE